MRELSRGEVVALVAPNGPLWLQGFTEILRAQAVPLLLDADAPPAERQRWLALAGGGRILTTTDDKRLHLSGEAASGQTGPARVLLCTSGSTGAPKLVTRTVDSLLAEGRRYVQWAGLTGRDRIVLPLPMWHAYALGWVYAAEVAGAQIVPLPPKALGRCQLELATATVLALVPATASLLALRARGSEAPSPRPLRLAMVGAGPVSEALERQFHEAFGIGLARNYGSTETGAVFAGAAGLPEGCLGGPMPGVEARIVGADGSPVAAAELVAAGELAAVAEPGELQVSVDGLPWHPMGDLAVQTPSGVQLIGRSSRAVRRGDRWVAPEEVESVLLSHPEVVDSRLTTASGGTGSTVLHAEVVGLRGGATDLEGIRKHLGEELAPHKTPERLRLVPEVRRGSSGKRLPPPAYSLGPPEQLVEAAQAYKRSELVFALQRLRVIDLLAGGPADALSIAERLGLDIEACEALLRAADDLGLVSGGGGPREAGSAVSPILRLEEAMSRTWLTRERLTQVARDGRADRDFDREGPDDDFVATYQAAMHSTAAHERVRLGLRLGGYMEGARLLEITCGPGRYALAAGKGARLIRAGRLSGAGEGPPAPAADERFDVVAVTNAIHLDGPGSDLAALADRLEPAGRLLIDDIFLGVLPPSIRLDWLTHGGASWPTVEVLTAGLGRAGLTIRRVLTAGKPPATLVVATKEAT